MIFVTGGTGLLGNCIVRELIARGLETRVLCREGTSREPFDGLPVEVFSGDLSSTDQLVAATKGCDAVVHSAAMIHIGWHRLAQAREVNVAGTQRLIEACLQNNAKLLHISTVDTLPAAVSISQPISEASAVGVPKTPCTYVVSKRESEQAVQSAIDERNLQAVILHPGFMLGPYDWKPSSGRMMLEITKAPVLATPRGGCSLCDARDVAVGVVNAIDQAHTGEHFILAGENLTYFELWRRMLAVAGKSKPMFRLGPGIRVAGTMIDAAFKLMPQREGDVNGATIAMGSLNHFYDSSKAVERLGYRCRPAEETLHAAWEWLQRFRR